ncbi:high affinity immunoglobulin epsilon receptor subunit gamma [Esox lucius]|uniref:high affinity immunoglobulin epsilon receptor subunit gamma n=1 Tax=Esox lucius TaxID=8010 RepID=UPI000198A960|nr:high affinity immunoglobulin epsilon receptor subunit gamma [Esox lucius]ACO13902.1 High affinity immunoglobulin epsilon receptor subunit gamma precursor [Esox lucius]
MTMGERLFVSAVPLWMSFGSAAALAEPQICYILDGILFVYGIILTVLYCRIKMSPGNGRGAGTGNAGKKEESTYMGLTPRAQDTYETIGQKKGLNE